MYSFIRLYALFFVALLMLIAVAGLIVDPSGFFYFRGIFLGNKVDKIILTTPLSTKPMILSTLKPEAVIIGSSRAGRGYNLKSFNAAGLPVKTYNMGIPGMIMEEAALLVDHLKDNHELTDIFLALDFGMFNTSYHARQEFKNLKSGKFSAHGSFMEKIRLYKTTLFSPDAIKALDQKSRVTTDVSGFFTTGSVQQWLKTNGHRKNTRHIEKLMVSNRKQNPNYPAQIERFKQTIEILSNVQKRVHIFVNPVHFRRLVIYSMTDQQQNYLLWLDDVIRIMCKKSTPQYQPKLTVFSGVNEITTEKFPDMGDTETRMRWYWELSHFNSSVGAMVLQQLNAQESSSDHFGSVLTCSNRGTFIARFEDDWNDFMATHPEIVREINDIVKSTHSGS